MKNEDVRLKFYTPQLKPIEVPYFSSGVPAGFPSPAADFEEDRISFDKIVFGHKISTKFVVKVEGSSMRGACIQDQDLIVVDKSLKPKTNMIAVCLLNGEFTLKRLKIEKKCVWLVPENPDYESIQVNDNEQIEIWGIVTHSLHDHLKNL